MANSNNNSENNSDLTEAVGSNEIINAQTKADVLNLSKIINERLTHGKTKKKLESDLAEALAKNTEIFEEKESLETEKIKKDAEIDALKKALWRKKNESTLTAGEKYQSVSEKLGNDALALVQQRCAERYGNK
jgi:hypothetical protein